MPYGIERQEGQFCVFKLDAGNKPTGDTLGCHATEDAAEAQRRALYASEEDDKAVTGQHEYKTLPFEVTNINAEGRTIEGYASVFGNVDLGGDIVHPGAFRKTLAERGNKVRFFWQHNRNEPLGKPIEMHEDARGLFFKAIISDTVRGRDALALLKDGAISGLSIGYDPIPGGTDIGKTADGQTVRNLRELRLWEVSLCSLPMNEAAEVLALKAAPTAPAPVVDPLTERKEALVATLRAALAEAEAFVAAQAAPETEDTAPADEAGRVEHAAEEGAEPPQALTPEQEAQRLALLAEIQQLTEED
jgi:hypothetical protein